MSRVAALVACAGFVFFSGCHSMPPERTVSDCGIPIHCDMETVSEDDLGVINSCCAYLPPDVQNSIEAIAIYKRDQHHVGRSYGHAYNSIICLNSVTLNTFWHEAAHTYHYYLDEEFDNQFTNEWLEAAGDVVYSCFVCSRPSQGVLTQYGGTEYAEDVAEWMSQCYLFYFAAKNHQLNEYREAFMRVMIDKDSDPRYRKKLVLLLKWGFISQDVFNSINPLLP